MVALTDEIVEEQLRLHMYYLLCSDLTTSLQFRDDIIDAMVVDSTTAIQKCYNAFTQTTDLISWWWDVKNITTFDSMNSLCNSWETSLLEQQEYGNVKNVGIDAAMESFMA